MSVVVMAGNGHYQTMTPEGPVPCRVKPNTTGMDFLLARVMDVWNALYEKLMIPPKDRHNLIVNCMRFTATVWENLVTAQAAAGRLIAVPPADANFQTMSLTEIRDSLKPLIQYGPPRGPEGGTVVSFNSQEVNTTRVASRKRKLNNNNIVVISSNVGSKNNDQKEEGNTLDVVCAVIPPGVPAPAPQRLRTELNDTDVNANTARNQPLENRDMAVNCIAYTSNFAGLFVGLLNHIGAMQTEVNPVVSAFYDWGCYYIKQFVSSSMDVFVRDNFSRMREGYKSRGVVMTIWLKTQHALSLGKKTKIDAIQHLWMDIQTDALTMVHVPIVFCNLLYRGVHMASLLMTSVIADHLKCPVVNVRNLNRFFELEAAPDLAAMDDGFKDDYTKILEFVRSCFVHNRFCPADDAPFCNLGNVSCYISGSSHFPPLRWRVWPGMMTLAPCRGRERRADAREPQDEPAPRATEQGQGRDARHLAQGGAPDRVPVRGTAIRTVPHGSRRLDVPPGARVPGGEVRARLQGAHERQDVPQRQAPGLPRARARGARHDQLHEPRTPPVCEAVQHPREGPAAVAGDRGEPVVAADRGEPDREH